QLLITAEGKGPDGMDLSAYDSFEADDPSRLPKEAVIRTAIEKVATDLTGLIKAPLVDPFTGPAILSGRAAGVFFHEIFGHRVEANRQRSADDGQTFASRIGQPVLPAFLSVIFDPTLKKVGGVELMGHYVY